MCCIALLGQFALGVSFLYGLSISSAIAVALTMATSLTFLPAMLGFLGPKVLSRRERAALAANGPTSTEGGGFWLRWARVIEARKALVALGALASVVVIALPISASGWVPPTPAPTRRAGPPTRRTPPSPRGSGPGSTGRSSWPPMSVRRPMSRPSASCWPPRPARLG